MVETDSLTSRMFCFSFLSSSCCSYSSSSSSSLFMWCHCCHPVDCLWYYTFFRSVDLFRNLHEHRRPCPISTQSTLFLNLSPDILSIVLSLSGKYCAQLLVKYVSVFLTPSGISTNVGYMLPPRLILWLTQYKWIFLCTKFFLVLLLNLSLTARILQGLKSIFALENTTEFTKKRLHSQADYEDIYYLPLIWL